MQPLVRNSAFGQIIGVSNCPNGPETALAGVKGELPNFARAGEGSSKFKGLFDITARGNERMEIFRDDHGRLRFPGEQKRG
jgi:hypothetical protein